MQIITVSTDPQAAPPVPAAPAAPRPGQPSPAPTAVVVGTDGVAQTYQLPRTAADLAALRARREELSSQLISAAGRREKLAREIRHADGANRAGLERRLIVLDNRILQLESDIAETGRLVSAAPSELFTRGTRTEMAIPGSSDQLSSGQITGISIVFIIFVLAPIALAFARFLFKRAGAPRPVASPENAQRLERLEQAVDTIAVEIERVSEGQRFVTRLLTEQRELAPLGAGQREKEMVRRGE